MSSSFEGVNLIGQKIFDGLFVDLVYGIGIRGHGKYYDINFNECDEIFLKKGFPTKIHSLSFNDENIIVKNNYYTWKIKKSPIDDNDFYTYKNILMHCFVLFENNNHKFNLQIYNYDKIIFEKSQNINTRDNWICGRFIICYSKKNVIIYDPFNNMKKVFARSFKNLSKVKANENNLLTLETIKSGASYSCNVKSFDISMLRDDKKYEKYVEGIILYFLGKDVDGLIKNYLIY